MNRLMTPLKFLLASMLAFGVAAGASAQDARQALSKDSVLQTILERGAINIGLSAFVPWAMRDTRPVSPPPAPEAPGVTRSMTRGAALHGDVPV